RQRSENDGFGLFGTEMWFYIFEHNHVVAVFFGLRRYGNKLRYEQVLFQTVVNGSFRIGRNMAVAFGVGSVAVRRNVNALIIGATAFGHTAYKSTHSYGIESYRLGPETIYRFVAGF